jgi:threonine dehydrogenase-like Zn-dependent dehydrogenase
MLATTIHGPGDIRWEEVADPYAGTSTDAVVRVVVGCVCGSDLWRYRGLAPVTVPGVTIGHECVGEIVEVGADVRDFRVGDVVIVPFDHCDGTCVHCLVGQQEACVNLAFTTSGQGQFARVTQADGTLVRIGTADERPDDALMPSFLALSDVMATGWHAAVSAGVAAGSTAVVVGDGAVGLCGVIAASALGAERVIAMSRHADRQALALEFGATEIIAERGDEAVARVMEATAGVGADAVLECVGTTQSMATAFRAARPGATVGFVGVPTGIEAFPIAAAFSRNVRLAGGMAPARKYIPELLELVLAGRIDPGRVFDMTLPMSDAAEGYRAMDERRAIKVLLQP